MKKKIVGLAHGVFDVLHSGHLIHFEECKKYCDKLIVSITDDKFVNKGPGRPAFTISNRLKFLQEIDVIDYVHLSNDFTSEKVIKNLEPNFYCKGKDYSISQIKNDKNLKKEIKALKSVKGKFKIIKEISFSSSEYINNSNLQNFSEDCKNYINSIRKKYNFTKIVETLDLIRKKNVLITLIFQSI